MATALKYGITACGTLNEVVVQPNNNGWTNANYIGNNGGTGTLNVNGGAVNFSTSGAVDISGTQGSGSTGTVNLNAGVMAAPNVTGGVGTSTLNFNGGTLRAIEDNATFLQGLTTAQVRNGGAVVDANGHAITIGQTLVHSTIGGDNATDGGLTVLDSSGTNKGVVSLSAANTFNGLTTVNSGTLELSNQLALQNSTLATSASSIGSLAFNPSVGGSFRVGGLSGNGNLVLNDTNGAGVTLGVGNSNANNTFSGGTSGSGTLGKIGSGTLTLNNTSSLNASTTVFSGTLRISGSVGGTGTIFVGGSGASGTPTLTGVGGGTITAPVVINGASGGVAGILAPSAGGTSPATANFANSLTLGAGAILNLTLSSNPNSGNDQVVMTGGNVLNFGAFGTVNITDPSGLSAGTYVLISNTGGTITGGAGWTPVISNPSGGQSYILGPQGTNFDLTVTGNPSITWTGVAGPAGAAIWDIGSTKNWTPSGSGTYADGDLVTFNNTGINTTNIGITGTVNPTLMTFSNTAAVPYTFTSGTIAGTGSAIISGGGTVSFFNTNTFTGGTSVTGGSTLNIGGNGGGIPPAGSYASSVIAVSGAGSNLTVGLLGALTPTAGVFPSLVLANGGAATFNNNVSQTIGGLNGDSTTSLTLNMTAGSTLTVTEGGTMAGQISGSNGLSVTGGNLTLSNAANASTFSGPVSVTSTSGGTLTISSDGALGSSNALVVDGGTLAANASFSLGASRTIALGATHSSGSLGVGGSNVFTVPGMISNCSSNNTLIKTGTGTLVLSGTNNTYSGGTTINGGTVRINNGTNLGAGTVTLNGGTLNVTPATTITPGLLGQYWSNQNPNGSSTFGFTNETTAASYFAGLPAANFTQQLPETGNNDQGWNGGINFLNNNGNGVAGVNNAFDPIGVNVGNNNVDARWTGSLILTQSETITFSTNSDDASFVILSGNGLPAGGQVIVNRDGGHGEGVTTGNAITLAAGTYSIDVPYNQGGGGWGVAAFYQIGANQFVVGVDDPTDGVSFGVVTFASGINVSNPLSVVGANNTLALNAATPAALGPLTFNNGAALTINGSAPSASFNGTTFNGGAVSLNTTPNVSFGTIANGNSTALTSFTKSGAGTLNISGSSDPVGVFTGAAININGGSITTLSSGTVTGLGTASKFSLNGANLTISGAPTGSGLQGFYFAQSPGGGNTTSNNWPTGNNTNVSSAADDAVIAALGTPTVTQVLPTTANVTNPTGGNTYTYTGGINFPNSQNNINAFAAVGVNIAGGGGNTNFPLGTVPPGGYNSITAEWKGFINVATAGAVNFALNSDDFAAIAIDGTIVVARGNGGTGFSNNNNASGGNLFTDNLTAGTHSIEVLYDEGGGGWGIVGAYNFNGGNTNTSTYGFSIGQDDTADGITFLGALAGINLSTPVVASGASSLTLNATTTATFTGSPTALTVSNGANFTVNGAAPSASFSNTAINGNITLTANLPVTLGAVSNGNSPAFTSLTMAGSSQLFLDSMANTAFISGTTIHANSGTTVGVNVTGIDSLGLATLDINGGTFSFGSDGAAGSAGDQFANPITFSNTGTLVAQQLGNGAVAGSTISLTGGIALNNASGTLTLSSNNGDTLSLNSALSGAAAVTDTGTVNLNVANPSYTGTFRVTGGTTTDNAVGALSTVSSATVNGGQLNVAANNEVVNNLTVNIGGTSTVNGSGVGFIGPAVTVAGGTLNVNSALAASSSPVNVTSGTLTVGTAGNLSHTAVTLGINNQFSGSALAVINGAGSLGSGSITLNPNSELRFTGSTGAANFAGSTISVNGGLVPCRQRESQSGQCRD